MNLPTNWGVLQQALDGGPLEFVACEDITDATQPLLQGAAILKGADGKPAGFLVISLYQNHLRRLLEGVYGVQNDLMLFSRYWRPVYCAQASLAETLGPKLRSRVLIFCYQLSHIRSGKAHIQKSLAVWKPELEHYTGLVQQIKEKSKERKTLVAEKKALPIYHVKRHKALAVRIAELTEDLEELRSEKALLVQKFEYAEDAGAEAFRKDIAIMEAGLKKLEAQEQKYSAELDKALDEYAELKAQAADFDSVELYKARQVLRPAQEKAAERQLEETLQKKPSFSLLLSAKQEVSRLLGEDTEERQARQMVIRRQRSDPQKPKHFQR